MRAITYFILTLVLFSAANSKMALAQDSHSQPEPGRVVNTRTSPFAPPKSSDRSFSTDKSPKLDTPCIFRSSGPITFTIQIKRYLGPLNADGTLRYARELKEAGLISPFVKLIMPAFDVDSGATNQGSQPELDKVTINDYEAGFLRGQNNQWVENSFEVPIEKVRFGTIGTNGGEPTGGMNTITIDIDTANSSEVWCTSIDWGAQTFLAMSPVILIHGNGSDGCFFYRQGLTAELDRQKIVYDKSIQLNPNADSSNPCPAVKGAATTDTHPIAVNARTLNDLIPGIMRQFGAQNVHLVAHSKGGLDAREYLAKYQRTQNENYKVLSLTTLSTPHNGSVLADISLALQTALEDPNTLADGVDLEGFPGWTATAVTLTNLFGIDEGRKDLRTFKVEQFNRDNIGLLDPNITFNTIGGDADRNSTDDIDLLEEYSALETESKGLRVFVPAFLARRVVNSMYQNLRLNKTVVSGATRCFHDDLGFLVCILEINPVPNPTPLKNDTLVTIPSALGEGPFQSITSNSRTFTGSGDDARNHSTIANEKAAEAAIPWLIQIDRDKGGLNDGNNNLRRTSSRMTERERSNK